MGVHQERVLSIIVVCEGEGVLEPEVSVPQGSWRIDALLCFDVPSDIWGPLREIVEGRVVVLEHYASRPNTEELTRAFTKLALIVDLWRGGEGGRRKWPERRAPLLLVMTNGWPKIAVANTIGEALLLEPGIKWLHRTPMSEALLIDLLGLANKPGYSVLRAMASRRDARWQTLLNDEGLPDSLRRQIEEALLKRVIPTSEIEHGSIVERIEARGREKWLAKGLERGLERGRKEGRKEGREEGRKEGREEGRRQMVLRLARHRLSNDEVTLLERLDDIDEMEAQLLAFLG